MNCLVTNSQIGSNEWLRQAHCVCSNCKNYYARNRDSHEIRNRILIVEGDLIYRDQFNRKWKLEPTTNPDIKFPFVITPLPTE